MSAGSSGPGGEAPAAADGPRRIVVAGDWHGNEEWAVSVIRRVPTLLAGQSHRIILHLGDFGIWPDQAGLIYLEQVSKVLAEVDAELWFVDGNHEDFSQLARIRRTEANSNRGIWSGCRFRDPCNRISSRIFQSGWDLADHDFDWIRAAGNLACYRFGDYK